MPQFGISLETYINCEWFYGYWNNAVIPNDLLFARVPWWVCTFINIELAYENSRIRASAPNILMLYDGFRLIYNIGYLLPVIKSRYQQECVGWL